ncbi:MAG: twin-arginine translocation signal domain-containing protein [Pirellulales bacterium]
MARPVARFTNSRSTGPQSTGPQSTGSRVHRRSFLVQSSAAAAALAAAPLVLTARKSEAKEIIVGEGEHRFQVEHEWPQLPAQYTWQTTHNVAVDKAGNLYVIHEGRANQKDHPSIFVFDSEGKFIRAFGNQFQGGGHGIEIREENGEEFLYVCAYQALKTFAKLSLKGETVWQQYAPMQSGVYAADEDKKPTGQWGRDRFMPTNFAFLDDGGFLLVDGYGAFYVHRYDKDGKWLSCFGGAGGGEGKFNTPHGIWVDKRTGRTPSIVVCDRANHTLQYFTMDGKYVETLKGYGLPANCETWKNLLVVPELHARVTLLNEKNEVVARLGDDVARVTAKDGGAIRGDHSKWLDGKFVHPHDACFGHDGSLFVAEWVGTGRVSRLKKLA